MKYFDKIFTEESININQQVPRSRVQSDYYGFTFTRNSVKNELDAMAPTKENENKNDVKEEDEDKNNEN